MNSSSTNPFLKPGDRVLFLTGRLAERLVRRNVEAVSADAGFSGEVHVLGISVAALMHVDWLLKKLPEKLDRYDAIIVPGLCRGDLSKLSERYETPFLRGPKEIQELGNFLGRGSSPPPSLDSFDIEIIAEINHAPLKTREEVLALADHYRDSGADRIDLGCVPGQSWDEIDQCAQELLQAGHRLSVDSFERFEVERAVAAGVDLILSCNSSNLDWVSGLGAEVVAIPDDPQNLESLWRTVDALDRKNCKFRIDPILEPVGYGFSQSLARYYEVRRRAESCEVMMGIGNVTELSSVDSSGVNFLLAAICQELSIKSVLTTEVAHWCRSSVKEFDISRRMVKYAIDERTLAKRVGADLLLLRDEQVATMEQSELEDLAAQLRDSNFRIFVEGGKIHIMNRDGYWTGSDPFELFDDLEQAGVSIDSTHAFYLGYELAKAVTAMTLGKQYRQDEALNWGFLTLSETSAVDRRHQQRKRGSSYHE
ncbi:hypothetical protein KOR42_40530 [Thalassoglobus neptunius]|uniref:Pterin-binding domain-containing protein n=1 Tax=Thalassoglobus neptunius TaxID=1938619 RepID=A0A5C5WD44_9PLAN|nr:DUF6513 domain-containing protein [Thalassoglobus neptunius]TWT47969.1 hypothetical protein KOR42_40530 [Thalassoglobus neptunius]